VASTFSDENHLEFRAEMIALGAESGTATFYLSDRSDASNSLAAGFRPSSNQIQVPVETLDSYVERTGLVPAVMKVDTETTEPDVLAGSAATIATHRPWILCEVLARRVEPRLEQTLAPHRYHWYPIEVPAPYREAGRIRGDRKYQNLMWLFAPERPGDEFWTALERRTAQLRECRPQRGASPRR
jgi:FkbM family methyltransferase